VLNPPDSLPIKVLYKVFNDERISKLDTPVESTRVKLAAPKVIILIDRTKVPSKSLVGVITKFPVAVALGSHVPVAVLPAADCPPKEIVIDPAVRPVIV
jgi:hypothetical protein